MHVTLLANYLPDGQQSMQRYAAMLRDLLVQQGIEVEVIRPPAFFGRLKPSAHGLGKWLGYLDKYLVFPAALIRHVNAKPTIVHICDHSNAPYTRWLREFPHVVTCHDVLAIQSARGLIPGRRTSWTGRILQSAILTGLRSSLHVVCVSDATRRDLLSLVPDLAKRTTVVDNALNYPYAPMEAATAREKMANLNIGSAPFVLHVGGNHWYKNREGVLRIFAQLKTSHPDLKLVMAGQAPTPEMKQIVREEKLEGRVTFVVNPATALLHGLYSLAETLVYPSLREGFGWPIIEAQACGCPVVTSDLPPMSQIAGPAALLADSQEPARFAACIAQILAEEPELRRRRRAEALRQAARYDTATFVQKMVETYRLISAKA